MSIKEFSNLMKQMYSKVIPTIIYGGNLDIRKFVSLPRDYRKIRRYKRHNIKFTIIIPYSKKKQSEIGGPHNDY